MTGVQTCALPIYALTSISGFEAIRNEVGTITDFRYTLLNKEALRLLGLKQEEVIGKNLTELFPSVRQSGQFETNVSIIERGEPQQTELHYNENSNDVWLLASSMPMGDTLFVTYADITKQKQAELDAQRQSELLMGIVDNGRAGITLFDPIHDQTGQIIDFRYVFTNAVNSRNTGRSAIEMTGNTLLTLLPLVAETEWFARLVLTAQTGESQSFLFQYDAEGIRGWFDTLFVKLGNQILFTDLNVTSLKEAQLTQQQQAELLKDRKSTRLNSSHSTLSRMPSSA